MTTDELFLAIYQTVSGFFNNHLTEDRDDYILVMNPRVHRFLKAYNQGVIAHVSRPIKDTIFGVEIEDSDEISDETFLIRHKEVTE